MPGDSSECSHQRYHITFSKITIPRRYPEAWTHKMFPKTQQSYCLPSPAIKKHHPRVFFRTLLKVFTVCRTFSLNHPGPMQPRITTWAIGTAKDRQNRTSWTRRTSADDLFAPWSLQVNTRCVRKTYFFFFCFIVVFHIRAYMDIWYIYIHVTHVSSYVIASKVDWVEDTPKKSHPIHIHHPLHPPGQPGEVKTESAEN